MRYSTAITAAFAAGAMAKPHGRRSKTCSSSAAQALSALASDAPAAPSSSQASSAAGQGTTATLVPVPPPAASSTSAYVLPSAVPTGNNGTIPQSTNGGNAVPSSAVSEEASSALPVASGPVTSDVPSASSALDASITSSALRAESSAPASDIPVGQAIFSCTEPGTFALTYDDGPFDYTDHILDLLAQTDIKVSPVSSFFFSREVSRLADTGDRPPSSSTATTLATSTTTRAWSAA